MKKIFILLLGFLSFVSLGLLGVEDNFNLINDLAKKEQKEAEVELLKGMIRKINPNGIVSFIKDVVMKEVGGESGALKAALEGGEYFFVNEFIGVVDGRGRTVLHEAADRGELEMVKVFVDMGMDVNAKDKEGKTVLHEMVLSEFHLDGKMRRARLLEIVRFLIEKGGKIDFVDGRGRTVLHEMAAKRGWPECARILIEDLRMDVNARDKEGKTALHILSSDWGLADEEIFERARDRERFYGREIKLMELLLEKGIDVNARDNNGNTALHEAAFRGRLEVVKVLLEKGKNLDINVRDKDGRTGLHGVVLKHLFDHEVVKCFINRGADVNARDNDGRTALHEAIGLDRFSEAEDLLRAGAYINVRDKNGRDPFFGKDKEYFFRYYVKGYQVKEESEYFYYYAAALGAGIGAAFCYYFNYVVGVPVPMPVPPEA